MKGRCAFLSLKRPFDHHHFRRKADTTYNVHCSRAVLYTNRTQQKAHRFSPIECSHLFSTSSPRPHAPPSWPASVPPPDPFELLGLSFHRQTTPKEKSSRIATLTEQDVRKAYFRLAKKLHPDTYHTTSLSSTSRSSLAGNGGVSSPSLTSPSASETNSLSSLFSFRGTKKQFSVEYDDSLPELAASFEDLQWAYEAALAHLKIHQENSNNHQHRGDTRTDKNGRSGSRQSAYPRYSFVGENGYYRFDQGPWTSASVYMRRLTRVQEQQVRDWQEQQAKARHFWVDRYQRDDRRDTQGNEKTSSPGGTTTEDDIATTKVFENLFKRRLSDEAIRDRANKEMSSRAAKKCASKQPRNNGIPREYDGGEPAFLHAQYEELRSFGVSPKEAEEVLGLPVNRTTDYPSNRDRSLFSRMFSNKNQTNRRKVKDCSVWGFLLGSLYFPGRESRQERARQSENSRHEDARPDTPILSRGTPGILLLALCGGMIGGISLSVFPR